MVNNSPVTILATPISAWNIPTSGAKWVSINAGGTSSGTNTYDYKLRFAVPKCAIDQEVRLTGTVGGGNNVQVLLNGAPISTCTNGTCFKASTAPPPFNAIVAPTQNGMYELIVRVKDEGVYTGIFINAKLVGKCSTKLTKDFDLTKRGRKAYRISHNSHNLLSKDPI